jgi:hypothetical protein
MLLALFRFLIDFKLHTAQQFNPPHSQTKKRCFLFAKDETTDSTAIAPGALHA